MNRDQQKLLHDRYARYERNVKQHRKWRIAYKIARSFTEVWPCVILGSVISAVFIVHHWETIPGIVGVGIVLLIITLILRRVSMKYFPRYNHRFYFH